MNDIINYFNNNAFIASIITLILSALITIIINVVERRLNRKDTIKDRKREERLNKGEFRVDRHIKGKHNDKIELIYTDYLRKEGNVQNYNCIYNEKNLNKKDVDKIMLPLKNIGYKEICEFYIAVNNRERLVLIEQERIKSAINGKYPNFVIGYYNKILPGESVLITLNFYKESKIFGSFSSELSIYYRDGYGNFYKQPIFLNEERVEGPYIIKSKEYIKETSLII